MESHRENIAPPIRVPGELHVHLTTWLVVISVCFIYLCQLIAIVGSGFLAQSMTQLLGGSADTVWFSQTINILGAALDAPITQAADYWGRKWFLVVLSALGFVGAMMVARAQNVALLIAGFTVIGLHTCSQPLLFTVIAEVLPRKHRPFAQASINLANGLGGVVALVMGGTLLRSGHFEAYRTYFYVNAGIFALSCIGCALFYHPPRRDMESSLRTTEKIRCLDWVGYLFYIPGLVLFCLGLSWSQNPYSWPDGHILGPFVAGLALIGLFSVYEWRFKKDGLMHHRLFSNRNFLLAAAAIFAEGLSFFTCNSYFVYEFSLFHDSDLLVGALHFSILFFTGCIACFAAGAYSAWRKVLRSPAVVGFGALLLFYILMATTTPSSPGNVFWGYPVLAGVGLATLVPVITVTAQLSTPPELIALASGLVVTFRALGGTVGLAINNAIFHSALSTELPKKIAAATMPLGLPASSLGALITALSEDNQAAFNRIPGVTDHIIAAAGDAYKAAYGVAFRNCWIAAACFCFVALIVCCFIIDPTAEFNSHIDAPVEKELVRLQKVIDGEHEHRLEDVNVDAKKCEP